MSAVSPFSTMEALARQAPDAPIAVVGDHTWSRRDLATQTRLLARILAAHGVGRGDRVCVVRRNSVLHLSAFLACTRLGAILVPVNSRLATAECGRILDDCSPRVVLCGPRHAEQFDAALTPAPSACWIVDDDDPAAGPPPGQLTPAWLRLSALIEEAQDAQEDPVPAPLGTDDVLMLQYTSGSTGAPRGVRQTVGNLCASWDATRTVLGLGDREVVLSIAPFGHVGGLNTLTLQVLLAGGLVVIQRQFDVPTVLAQIEQYGVTATFGVPTMYQAIVDDAEFATRRLSTLRTAIIGGAPVPPQLAEILIDRGIGVVVSWGMTELTGGGAYLPTALLRLHPTSVGFPSPGLEARVASTLTGRTAPTDTIGELWVRGPIVSPGYWGAAGGPEDIARGGWFRTGDLARMDAEGLIHLAGRSKDLIISGGENIRPAEIELLAGTHPAVASVCVVGAPDPLWGEMPVAVVEAVPGMTPPTLSELRAHLEPHLARFKLPRRLILVEEMPLGATGKIDRSRLRELARDLTPRREGRSPQSSRPAASAPDAARAGSPGSPSEGAEGPSKSSTRPASVSQGATTRSTRASA